MNSHEAPAIEINHTRYAYEVHTHFLNHRGGHSHRLAWVDEPTIEAAQAKLTPPDTKSEVAWINFNAHAQITATIGNKEEILYGKRHAIGELHLASMWEDEKYSFSPLSELIAASELPIYTAAWLARYINGTGRKSQGEAGLPVELIGLDQHAPLAQLLTTARAREVLPGMKDADSIRLRPDILKERSERLAQLAMNEHPHLKEWYAAREII